MAPKFGGARSYKTVDLSSRVEGASPHRLVGILFDELGKALEAMAAAMKRRDFTQRGARQARALAILHGLEASLDHERGGDLARDLAIVYAEARRLVLDGARTNDPEPVVKARDMVAEIASAWAEIG